MTERQRMQQVADDAAKMAGGCNMKGTSHKRSRVHGKME